MEQGASGDPLAAAEEAIGRARVRGAQLRQRLDSEEEGPAPEEEAAAFLELVAHALDAVEALEPGVVQIGRERKAALQEALDALIAEHEVLEERLRTLHRELGERLVHLQQGGRTLKAYSSSAGRAPSYFVDRHS